MAAWKVRNMADKMVEKMAEMAVPKAVMLAG